VSLTHIAPVFQVADMARSLTFYRDQPGFDVAFVYEGSYAAVRRDGCHIHLNCAPPAPRDQAAFERAERIDACVVVTDAQSLSAGFGSAGVPIVVAYARCPTAPSSTCETRMATSLALFSQRPRTETPKPRMKRAPTRGNVGWYSVIRKRGGDCVRTVIRASVLGLFAILGPLTLLSLSAAPKPANDEAAIEQLERDRQDAFVRGDIDALDRETASDYSTINGVGKLSTKPQMMQNLRAGKTKVLSVKLDNLKARIYGDTAVLTGDYRDVNVRDGVQRETHALFTRVFVKNDGRWQAVAYQQTLVVDH